MKTTSTVRSILADVNVWLATLVAGHPHHEAAASWWRDVVIPSGATVAFCRLTQLGLLRLLCNEPVMGRQRLDHAQAWETFKEVNAQSNVTLVGEPANLDDVLEQMCRQNRYSPSFWSDAYLAAFARAGQHRFATFDRGFRRFAELDVILLGS